MGQSDLLAYQNGRWLPFSEVTVNPNDRGFLTGDAVFDAARTFDGVGFLLEAHIDRLYRSLHVTRIDPGIDRDEMLEITQEVIRRNEEQRPDAGDYQVWQWVTRGPGRWAHTAGPPSVVVKVAPIDFGKYAHLYESGAHAVVTRSQALTYGSVDPKLKTYSRMHFNLAELEAGMIDPDGWPVLLDGHGNLTEGSGYNLFVVQGGKLYTPPAGSVLSGISRGFAMELARRSGLEVVEKDLQPFDLYTGDEAFFTGTSPCILPVTMADGLTVGNGRPGPVTARLLADWSEEVGVDIAGQARKYAVSG